VAIDKNLFLSGVVEKYDQRLLKGRVEIEGNVISCIAKEITLLDDTKLTKDNFISRDGRFYFGLINELRKKGFNTVDEVTILSNMKEAVIDAFNERGGYDSLSHMIEVINTSNFDTYLENLYKSDLLLKLNLDDFPLFKKMNIKGKEVVPFELFQRMKPEQIIDFYDTRLSGYDLGESSEIIEEEDIFFEDDWEDKLEENAEIGTPYDVCGVDINGDIINGFSFMSRQTIGLHAGLMFLAGFSGVGKSTIFVTLIMALLYRGEKIIILSNEERIHKFKIKFMVFLLARYCRYYKCTKSKLTTGDLTAEDRKQIKLAKKYFNENYKGCLKFVSINSNDMTLIKKKIRDAHLRYGFTGYLVDTFKLSDDAFGGERQDLSLVKDSRELHNLSMKYNLIGMCSCQCAERFKGTLNLTASVLSSSKQVKEVLCQLLMCRTLYNDIELDPKSKYFCHPFRMENVGTKDKPNWVEKPYDLDPTGVYIVVAVEKNRDGQDTGSNGVSYILKFDGHLSVFREVAQARIQHGIIQG